VSGGTTTPPPALSHGWLLLAVGSLGLSAFAALVLVFARTPLLTALVPADTFSRALVVHVNLATTIWYLAMACGLWTERLSDRRHAAARAAFGLALAGALGVIATGFASPGTPVLANYVPYLTSPLFLASLGAFAAGGFATLLLSMRRPRDAAEWGFMIARWPFLMAALYLAVRLVGGASPVDALWGAGHLLQFGHVTLLMAIWLRLLERAGGAPMPARAAIPLFAAAALPATLAPALYLGGVLGGEALHGFHTGLMRWANWPAALAFGLILLRDVRTVRRADALAASIGLFLAGCLAGAAIDSQTTMIPAHYHGTIGAFTLALMAAALARLSAEPARPGADPSRLPLTLYSFGIVTLIAGLAWSGALGAPRKSPFSGEGADLGATLAAALTGLGGAVTVAGVLLFMIVAAPRIFRLCTHRPPLSRNESPRGARTFAAAR
jgi:hypothetical protein